MRTHGWSGDAPATDEEAVARILAAARRQIDLKGSDVSLAEVARDIGVARQTVYRYFLSSEALLTATAIAEAAPFLDRMANSLRGLTDPAEAVVEGIAYTLERLPSERYLNVLLTPGRSSAFTAQVTSDVAVAFGRSIIERFDVDWAHAGARDDDLDELADFMLRMLQSLIINPGQPPKTGDDLRAYLRRWVAPALSRFQSIGDGPSSRPAAPDSGGYAQARAVRSCLETQRVSRYLLVSEAQWSAVSHLMPARTERRGRPSSDPRQILEGIVYRQLCGIPWRSVPSVFGAWQTIWSWYRRMVADATWDRLQDLLTASRPDPGVPWPKSPDGALRQADSRAAMVVRAQGGWIELHLSVSRTG
ncbi:MAG: hypothetical protein NVSMB60_06680 [Mycobacterium sp.]